MLKLYQPARAWGLPNVSPSCMKLETWLRMTGIPYELPPVGSEASPKGKIPFIRDEGRIMGDSTLILEHLKQTRGVDPDRHLSEEQLAISCAFRRMIKEHLYWQVIFVRYLNPAGWDVYRRVISPLLGTSEAEQIAVAEWMRKQMLERLVGHGLGVHNEEEAHRLFIEDLRSISDFLGTKPFFFGDRPTTVDATVYSHVANIIEPPLSSPSTEFGRSRHNLVDYCKRMRARFFPELVPN